MFGLNLLKLKDYREIFLNLHRSRAEFFILTGRHDAAVFQLKEALSLSQNLFEIRESIIRRLEEIFAAKRALTELS